MTNLDQNQLHKKDKKLELENLEKKSLVRSRIQWLSEGENKHLFCKLESKSYIDKTIKNLELLDDTITNDQCKIQEEAKITMQNFLRK